MSREWEQQVIALGELFAETHDLPAQLEDTLRRVPRTRDVLPKLPSGELSMRNYAHDAAILLQRDAAVDTSLFDALVAHSPTKADRIGDVAQLYGLSVTPTIDAADLKTGWMERGLFGLGSLLIDFGTAITSRRR